MFVFWSSSAAAHVGILIHGNARQLYFRTGCIREKVSGGGRSQNELQRTRPLQISGAIISSIVTVYTTKKKSQNKDYHGNTAPSYALRNDVAFSSKNSKFSAY